MSIKTCLYCKTKFKCRSTKRKYCSLRCFYDTPVSEITRMKKRKYSLAHPIKFWLGKKNPYNTGKNNNHWNGGITRRHGYILILSKNHPNKNYENYVWEHRLIVEKIIGRYLLPDERVHHINGIRDDNRTKNLYLFSTNGEHACFHGLKNKSILKSNLSQKSICR